MKKLFYFASLLLLTSCIEAPGPYSDRAVRTGDYAVEVTIVILAIMMAIFGIFIMVSLSGIKDKVVNLYKKYESVNNKTDKHPNTEYFVNKELYGKEHAKNILLDYVANTYYSELGTYPTKEKIATVAEKLSKNCKYALKDANICLPTLEEFIKVLESDNGGFLIGGRVRIKDLKDNQSYKIDSVDPVARKVSVVSNFTIYTYSFDEVEVVEQ